jgi:hypothetical protein
MARYVRRLRLGQGGRVLISVRCNPEDVEQIYMALARPLSDVVKSLQVREAVKVGKIRKPCGCGE